jgi:hypothetical protein
MARLPIALVLYLAFLPRATAADEPVMGYLIQATVKEVRGDGRIEKAKLNILASPKVYTIEGREAHVLVGDQTTISDQKVQGGISFKVKAKETSEDKICVTGVLELSTFGPSTADFVVRKSTSFHFAKTVVSGETVRLVKSEPAEAPMWLELRVDRHAGKK